MVTRTRTYDDNAFTIYDACTRSVKDCGFNIKESNKSEGLILAETGATLRSWGEVLRITLTSRDNRTIVKVTSSPKAQLIDWGKNSENIDRFLQNLDMILG